VTTLEIMSLIAVGVLLLCNRAMAAEAKAYHEACLDAERRLAEERRANRRPWYASRVEAN
jgi:hypothetical protein